MQVTLGVLREVKQCFDLATFVGIDNSGFAMPYKDLIDTVYLLAAVPAGMDVALVETFFHTRAGREGLCMFFAGNFISGKDAYTQEYLAYL